MLISRLRATNSGNSSMGSSPCETDPGKLSVSSSQKILCETVIRILFYTCWTVLRLPTTDQHQSPSPRNGIHDGFSHSVVVLGEFAVIIDTVSFTLCVHGCQIHHCRDQRVCLRWHCQTSQLRPRRTWVAGFTNADSSQSAPR